MNESEVVAVEVLWARLRDMENKRRFQGLAYPSGMSVFPFRLGGQGFFPGGYLPGTSSPAFGRMSDSARQPENQVHCNDTAFVPQFSERNSGSFFSEGKWTAG